MVIHSLGLRGEQNSIKNNSSVKNYCLKGLWLLYHHNASHESKLLLFKILGNRGKMYNQLDHIVSYSSVSVVCTDEQ